MSRGLRVFASFSALSLLFIGCTSILGDFTVGGGPGTTDGDGGPKPNDGPRAAILAEANFNQLTPGGISAADLQAATHLSFERAGSGYSVQVSPSEVVTTGVLLEANGARIGQRGDESTRGLVLEEERTNVMTNSRMSSGAPGWNSARSDATVTYDVFDGPDKQPLADRVIAPIESYGPFQSMPVPIGTWITGTWWARAAAGKATQRGYIDGGSKGALGRDMDATWRRVSITTASIYEKPNLVPVSGQTLTMGPGEAIDNVIDMAHFEAGRFGTEVITTGTTTATRKGEHLFHPRGKELVDDGHLGLEFRFIPKAATNEYSSDIYLFYVDAGNAAWIDPTSQRLHVKIGGLDYVPAVAFPWSAGDTVELWLETGGKEKTTVKSRLNYGPVTLHGVSDAPQPPVNISGPIDILGKGTQPLSSWVQRVAAYSAGNHPQWTEGPEFTPATISGCVLWARADKGVVQDANGRVSAWEDQSGKKNNLVQETAANQLSFTAGEKLYNGFPVLKSSGAGWMYTQPLSYSAFTYVMVGQLGTTNTYAYYRRTVAGDPLEYLWTTTGASFLVRRNANTSSGDIAQGWMLTSVPVTYVHSYDGTSLGHNVYTNGTYVKSGSGSNPGNEAASGPLHLFADKGTSIASGVLAEFIVYDHALNASEREVVERYLRARYGHY